MSQPTAGSASRPVKRIRPRTTANPANPQDSCPQPGEYHFDRKANNENFRNITRAQNIKNFRVYLELLGETFKNHEYAQILKDNCPNLAKLLEEQLWDKYAKEDFTKEYSQACKKIADRLKAIVENSEDKKSGIDFMQEFFQPQVDHIDATGDNDDNCPVVNTSGEPHAQAGSHAFNDQQRPSKNQPSDQWASVRLKGQGTEASIRAVRFQNQRKLTELIDNLKSTLDEDVLDFVSDVTPGGLAQYTEILLFYTSGCSNDSITSEYYEEIDKWLQTLHQDHNSSTPGAVLAQALASMPFPEFQDSVMNEIRKSKVHDPKLVKEIRERIHDQNDYFYVRNSPLAFQTWHIGRITRAICNRVWEAAIVDGNLDQAKYTSLVNELKDQLTRCEDDEDNAGWQNMLACALPYEFSFPVFEDSQKQMEEAMKQRVQGVQDALIATGELDEWLLKPDELALYDLRYTVQGVAKWLVRKCVAESDCVKAKTLEMFRSICDEVDRCLRNEDGTFFRWRQFLFTQFRPAFPDPSGPASYDAEESSAGPQIAQGTQQGQQDASQTNAEGNITTVQQTQKSSDTAMVDDPPSSDDDELSTAIMAEFARQDTHEVVPFNNSQVPAASVEQTTGDQSDVMMLDEIPGQQAAPTFTPVLNLPTSERHPNFLPDVMDMDIDPQKTHSVALNIIPRPDFSSAQQNQDVTTDAMMIDQQRQSNLTTPALECVNLKSLQDVVPYAQQNSPHPAPEAAPERYAGAEGLLQAANLDQQQAYNPGLNALADVALFNERHGHHTAAPSTNNWGQGTFTAAPLNGFQAAQSTSNNWGQDAFNPAPSSSSQQYNYQSGSSTSNWGQGGFTTAPLFGHQNGGYQSAPSMDNNQGQTAFENSPPQYNNHNNFFGTVLSSPDNSNMDHFLDPALFDQQDGQQIQSAPPMNNERQGVFSTASSFSQQDGVQAAPSMNSDPDAFANAAPSDQQNSADTETSTLPPKRVSPLVDTFNPTYDGRDEPRKASASIMAKRKVAAHRKKKISSEAQNSQQANSSVVTGPNHPPEQTIRTSVGSQAITSSDPELDVTPARKKKTVRFAEQDTVETTTSLDSRMESKQGQTSLCTSGKQDSQQAATSPKPTPSVPAKKSTFSFGAQGAQQAAPPSFQDLDFTSFKVDFGFSDPYGRHDDAPVVTKTTSAVQKIQSPASSKDAPIFSGINLTASGANKPDAPVTFSFADTSKLPPPQTLLSKTEGVKTKDEKPSTSPEEQVAPSGEDTATVESSSDGPEPLASVDAPVASTTCSHESVSQEVREWMQSVNKEIAELKQAVQSEKLLHRIQSLEQSVVEKTHGVLNTPTGGHIAPAAPSQETTLEIIDPTADVKADQAVAERRVASDRAQVTRSVGKTRHKQKVRRHKATQTKEPPKHFLRIVGGKLSTDLTPSMTVNQKDWLVEDISNALFHGGVKNVDIKDTAEALKELLAFANSERAASGIMTGLLDFELRQVFRNWASTAISAELKQKVKSKYADCADGDGKVFLSEPLHELLIKNSKASPCFSYGTLANLFVNWNWLNPDAVRYHHRLLLVFNAIFNVAHERGEAIDHKSYDKFKLFDAQVLRLNGELLGPDVAKAFQEWWATEHVKFMSSLNASTSPSKCQQLEKDMMWSDEEEL